MQSSAKIDARQAAEKNDGPTEREGADTDREELRRLIRQLAKYNPDLMPMLTPRPEGLKSLINRWESAKPEMTLRFKNKGTLKLQATYRLMLMEKQVMLDRRLDGRTIAEQEHLLLQ